MDNGKLEMVNNEGLTEVMPANTQLASTILPVAGGVAAGLIGGFLLCKFVAEPIIAKIKANKAAAKVEVEAKPEESK